MSGRIGAVNRLLYKHPQRKRCAGLGDKMVKRTQTSIVVGDVNLQPARGDIKKEKKYLYPGGLVQRAEHLDLSKYNDPIDPSKARRLIESNLFVTLNTNRTYRGKDEADAKDAMVKTLETMAKDSMICQMIVFGPKSAHFRDDKYADVIKSIEWKACVETGEKLHRLHAHIHLTVHHYSQVQVSYPLTQEIFRDEFNKHAPAALRMRGKPYIHVKLLPSSAWAEIVKQYIAKQSNCLI